jgi:hypothetical protein
LKGKRGFRRIFYGADEYNEGREKKKVGPRRSVEDGLDEEGEKMKTR